MKYITTKFKKYTFKGLECNGISINGNGITDQFTNGNQSIKTEINSSVITQPVEMMFKIKLELSNTTQFGFLLTCIKSNDEWTSPYSLRICKDSNGYKFEFYIRRGYGSYDVNLITYFENNLDWIYVKFVNDGENQTVSIYDSDLNLLNTKTEKNSLTPVWDNYHTNFWIYYVGGGGYGNTLVPKFVQYDLSESYIKDLTTGKLISDWNK